MARFEGGVSPKTVASIPRITIRNVDDLYPAREATPSGTDFRGNNIYPVKNPTETVERLLANADDDSGDTLPTTTKDMSRLYQWEIGDEIRGSHAKKNNAMKNYVSDILGAMGSQDGYKHIFVDTLKPIGPQLEQFKSRRKKRRTIEG